MSKTANADIADEIISQTFLKVYEHLKEYNPQKAAFSTWIFQIALNEMKMFWRKNNYLGEHEEVWDENFNPAAPEFEEPKEKFLQKETQNKIREALKKIAGTRKKNY